MRINLDHMARRDVLCEFDYWPLAVSMPPTKVCPHCKAAVPVRRKTCERCDLVFRSKRKTECNLREKTVITMKLVSLVPRPLSEKSRRGLVTRPYSALSQRKFI